MFDSEDSIEKAIADLQTMTFDSDDIEFICDDTVHQILEINKQSQNSNENLIAILSDEDEAEEVHEKSSVISFNEDLDLFLRLSEDELDEVEDVAIDRPLFVKDSNEASFESLLNDLTDDHVELNNNDESIPFTEASQSKVFEDNHISNATKQTIVFPEYLIIRKRQYLLQKSPTEFETGKLRNITNNALIINPRVVLERLPISKIPINVTDAKKITTKKRKAKIYRCSDCRFKTSKRRNMVFHLDESSHSYVRCQGKVISSGKFCCPRQSKIDTSNKSYECSYKNCDFTAEGWKLMYNHVKFKHINVSRKLKLKAVVILERLPFHIVNTERPISMKDWLPHSRGFIPKEITSTTKYSCSFRNCMFVTQNWKIMERHVKLSHEQPVKEHKSKVILRA